VKIYLRQVRNGSAFIVSKVQVAVIYYLVKRSESVGVCTGHYFDPIFSIMSLMGLYGSPKCSIAKIVSP